jgi:hypothetical protein
VGPDNPNHRSLNIGVSIVTHKTKGAWHYAIPGICLRVMEGDTKWMTEDGVVPKTSLNLTLS